jgi:hypothetical protein
MSDDMKHSYAILEARLMRDENDRMREIVYTWELGYYLGAKDALAMGEQTEVQMVAHCNLEYKRVRRIVIVSLAWFTCGYLKGYAECLRGETKAVRQERSERWYD